jgi:hypothetical protein
MKKALVLALLLAAMPLVAGDADATFDPKDKISLDLREAPIADLVTTLGALANMPVYIDPDVSGTITLKLDDVPFETVLAILNGKTGVYVRIDNGKLVASRSAESLFAAATLPDAFQRSPRIALSDFDKVKSAVEPVYAVVRSGDQELCYKLPFPSGEPPTYVLRIGSGDDAPRGFLTQFAYEPVYRARYFVLEYGERSAVLLLMPGKYRSIESSDVFGGFKVKISDEPRDGCREGVSVKPLRGTSSMTGFEVRAIGSDGESTVVMAPRLQFLPGQVFGMRSEIQDDRTGQHRQMVISGYVTRDGRSVAATLQATAIWIDPRDGREYYFAQPDWPSVRMDLFPLGGERALVGKVPAGVATPKPLELWTVGSGGPTPAPPVQNDAKDLP